MKKACRKLGVTRWPYIPRKPASMGTLQMMAHNLQGQQDKVSSVCSISIPRGLNEAMCEEDPNSPLPFMSTNLAAFSWSSAALGFKNSFVLETLALDLPFFDPMAENSPPPPPADAEISDDDWARGTSSYA